MSASCVLTRISNTVCIIYMVWDAVAADSSLNLLSLLSGHTAGLRFLVSVVVRFGHVTET